MIYQRILYQSFLWRGLYFASTFLLNILFARFYQASESGLIFFITNSYAFVLLLASLSLESGMAFFVSRNEIAAERLLNLSLIWSVIIGVAIFLTIYFFKHQDPGSFSKGLYLLSGVSYVSGILLSNFCSGLFYGKKNFITPNLVCTGCNLFLVIFICVSFVFPAGIFNSRNYIYLYFLMFPVQGLLLAITVKIYYSSSWRPSLPAAEQVKKLLRYSLTAFVANIIFFLVYRIDYWFVKAFCSTAELGNYVQVSKIGQVLITIPSVLATAIFTLTAGGQTTAVNEGLKSLSRVLLIMNGGTCLMLAVTGKWLFPAVFGPSFTEMYLPFLLLIPGVLSISALYPLSAYYSARNMIGVNIVGSSVALMFIVAADFVLIPRFGIGAAALVSSVGYMLYHTYVLMYFRDEYKTPISGFFKIEKADLKWMRNFIFNTPG